MISVERLAVQSGSFRLDNVDFSVETGRYAVLMGRTGCGKTVLLETLCGLKASVSGHILLGGKDVTHWKPGERDIGYVSQDCALFPTMTVYENVAFALRIRHWSTRDIRDRVEELAELLHIAPLLRRRPAGLSGGEIQRSALGRALAFRPAVLCLDEPFGAIDHDTRQGMWELLKNVQRRTGVTTLHVTHDREEAQHLADTLLLMEQISGINNRDSRGQRKGNRE